ncbi:MAG: hypothetical protein RDU14_16850 [Melioribacteraceae bacterium]|nr:hypothetical protein [Melioribacteraceae bacterium]
MENNEKEIEKKETISAEISRDQHKQIKKIAIDMDKDIRDIYAAVIPLGIAEYAKRNSLTVQPV